MDWRRKKEGLARGYDRSTSDSKEAPILRATPQCSNSIDYCCRCTSYPALANDKYALIPGPRQASDDDDGGGGGGGGSCKVFRTGNIPC